MALDRGQREVQPDRSLGWVLRLGESFQNSRFGLAQPKSLGKPIDTVVACLAGLHDEKRDRRFCVSKCQKAQLCNCSWPVSRRVGETNFIRTSFCALLA